MPRGLYFISTRLNTWQFIAAGLVLALTAVTFGARSGATQTLGDLAARGLVTPTGFDPSKPTVVIVHGDDPRSESFRGLSNEFANNTKYNVFFYVHQPNFVTEGSESGRTELDRAIDGSKDRLVSYTESLESVDDAQKGLRGALQHISAVTGIDKIAVVGHSLGGILARKALTQAIPGLKKIVFLSAAAPYAGVEGFNWLAGVMANHLSEYYSPMALSNSSMFTGQVDDSVYWIKLETDEKGAPDDVVPEGGQTNSHIGTPDKTITIKAGHVSVIRYTYGYRTISREIDRQMDPNLLRNPWLWTGVAVGTGVVVGTAGGSATDSNATSIGTGTATSTAPPATTTTASTSTTTAPATTTTQVSFTGDYDFQIERVIDPGGHFGFIGTLPSVVSFDGDNGRFVARGSAPFVRTNGSINMNSGRFNASGNGTVAGFSGVRVEFDGQISPSSPYDYTGSYRMGTRGALPGGQAIEYRVRGRMR